MFRSDGAFELVPSLGESPILFLKDDMCTVVILLIEFFKDTTSMNFTRQRKVSSQNSHVLLMIVYS